MTYFHVRGRWILAHFYKLCCCLPTPLICAIGGGESGLPACGPPAVFSVHLASNAKGDNVVRMWVQLERLYVDVTTGHSGDGCDLASTLCKYNL